MRLFADPRVFNYVIMALYLINMVRWAYESKWGDASYWLGAFWITASVTFLMKH